MKKKILVCGSAGFLMSNFIRYLFFRSKEYEVVSIDSLININDYKRIYINKNHKFYIGDCTDLYFMDRLIKIENPDYIINGIGCYSFSNLENFHKQNIINSFLLFSKYNIPIIQLGFDNYLIDNMYKDCIVLLLPNCFGFRQKVTIGIGNLLYNIINNKIYPTSKKQIPWVYAEDVASLIWFLMENKINKNIVHMPTLGFASLNEVSKLISDEFNIDAEESEKCNIILENVDYYKGDKIKGWCPDSNNIEESLVKTIRWYKANKWSTTL